jgi:hypothetical protein
MTLLALTLAQPWPWAVLELGKRLENRTWSDRTAKQVCETGQWLAIHGGKVPPKGKNKKYLEFDQALRWLVLDSPGRDLTPDCIDDWTFRDFTAEEGIVAVCQIETIYKPFEGLAPRHCAQDGWRARGWEDLHDQYAWIFHNLIILENPVKVPGAQGLWAVTGDVLEQVRIEARRARELVSR